MKQEIHTEQATPRLAPSRVRRASWGAIFAGMFVTLVIQITLMLLGAAVGLSTIEPLRQQNPTQGLAIGAGIWLLVSSLISTWIGACIAGRLSGGPRRADGMLHGIVTWSVATVAMLTLMASAVGNIVGGAATLVGNALPKGGGALGGQTASGWGNGLQNALTQGGGALLPPTGRTEGQQTPGQLTGLMLQDPDLAAAVSRMAARGGAAKAPQERDQVVNLLTSKHNMDQQEAQTLVNRWSQEFQQIHSQANQQARQVGSSVVQGAEQGAWWGFITLILGLAVAAWGGWAGTASLPRQTEAAVVAA